MKNSGQEFLDLINVLEINKELIPRLLYLGILKDEKETDRDYNIGHSNYATHIIQPWSLWLDYPELTTWDHDIFKRILRTKNEGGMTNTESRILDYEKIMHICKERLRQLKYEKGIKQ